ncbi:MAG TPA: DUF4402 domain-containing protein [Gillisia sp.]|nr:DUF4402 domain-containing protein [Gillisia sp.]
MKKITLLTAIVMIAFTANSFGQVEASVATSANVITPITIEGVNALNFGDIVGTAAGGTVTVSATGERSSSVTDLLIATTGTISAASFTVTGEAEYGFDITLPESYVVSNTDATPATMAVDTFTSAPDATGTLTAGTETVTVGATLTLIENQASGTYTSTDGLAITVQYN